jgi:endo-1,4-beta-D-glucanase Y
METTMKLENSVSRRGLVLGGVGSLVLTACGGGGDDGDSGVAASAEKLALDTAAEKSACLANNTLDRKAFSTLFNNYYTKVMGARNDSTASGTVYTAGAWNWAACVDKSNYNGIQNTVKSEGQGYGMMLAAMMDDKPKFYALWNYSATKMMNQAGPDAGLFGWLVDYSSGKVQDWGIAPDGDIWIITALLIAEKRWNDSGYGKAATNMLNKLKSNWSRYFGNNVVYYYPGSNDYDPSYCNPGFLQFWNERRPNTGWGAVVNPHRQLLIKSTNNNGLASDFSDINGNATRGSGHGFDAYRVTMNQAFDRQWNGNSSHDDNALKLLKTQGSPDGKNWVQTAMYSLSALVVGDCQSQANAYTSRFLSSDLSAGNQYYSGLLSTIAAGMLAGRFNK